MTTFLTGSTGYIGSYVTANLLRAGERLALLVRAENKEAAEKRLWKSLQLHMGFEEFLTLVRGQVDIYLGDLTSPDFGWSKGERDRLVRELSSVVHIAASLNRKSAKSCFNVNLRGTLTVAQLARDAADHHGLRRFSDVSTTAVAGKRDGGLLGEDEMIDWDRSDYDPYARTKKFCEHLVHELLPDVKTTIFRPSTVLGDSRFPETTQFDMVRAMVFLAYLPVLPYAGHWRHDIVPANYVGEAISTIHTDDDAKYDAYNLSAGAQACSYRDVCSTLEDDGLPVKHVYVPQLNKAFDRTAAWLMNTPRPWGLSVPASMMKVFHPYLTFDTVFDNSRVAEALGRKPTPITDYIYPLLQFAVDHKFSYPHRPWPEGNAPRTAAMSAAALGGG